MAELEARLTAALEEHVGSGAAKNGEVSERVDNLETWLAEVEDKVSAAVAASGGEEGKTSAIELISQLQTSFAENKAGTDAMAASMDADGDATIDKSEFTAWAEQHGATVAALEARLTGVLAASEALSLSHEESKLVAAQVQGSLSENIGAGTQQHSELSERVDNLETWLAEVEEKVVAAVAAAGAEEGHSTALELISELRITADTTSASQEAGMTELEGRVQSSLSALGEQMTRLMGESSEGQKMLLEGQVAELSSSLAALSENCEENVLFVAELETKVNEGTEALKAENAAQLEAVQAQWKTAAEEAKQDTAAFADQIQTSLAPQIEQQQERATQLRTDLDAALERVAAVEKLTDDVAIDLQDELVAKTDGLGKEIEKCQVLSAECGRTIGEIKGSIDGVKDTVAAHDKAAGRLDALREEVGKAMDQSSHQLATMQATMTEFTTRSSTELTEVGSLTRRIIASSSTADLDQVLTDANLSILNDMVRAYGKRAVKLTAQIGEVDNLARKIQNVEAQCEATLMMVTMLQSTEAANAAASGKKGKKR